MAAPRASDRTAWWRKPCSAWMVDDMRQPNAGKQRHRASWRKPPARWQGGKGRTGLFEHAGLGPAAVEQAGLPGGRVPARQGRRNGTAEGELGRLKLVEDRHVVPFTRPQARQVGG